jgi:hypothetical protein
VSSAAAALRAQLPARELHATLRDGEDANLLPPPPHMVVLSLGYRAALADLLWARTLILNGTRLQERRRFDGNVPLLDIINELDPTWRDPYRLADTLVTLQVKTAPLDQVRAVRRVLERGVRERPYDAGLWLVLGQFVGWIAPPAYFEDRPEEADAWRRAGAGYMARAAELGAADPSIQWQVIGAQRLFADLGQAERGVEMLLSMLATTDDPELRAELEARLDAQLKRRKLGQEERRVTEYRARRDAFERLAREHYPGANGVRSRLLGFPTDRAACAGDSVGRTASGKACASSWRDWSANVAGEAVMANGVEPVVP